MNTNSNSLNKENITIVGRLYKSKIKKSNIMILKKKINLKGKSNEKFLRKNELSL